MTFLVCVVLEFLGVFQFILSWSTNIDNKESILNTDYNNNINQAKKIVRVASQPIKSKSSDKKTMEKKTMEQRHIVKKVFSKTVNNKNNTISTFTLRFKEKTTSIGKMVFAEKSSNFTLPFRWFSVEICKYNRGYKSHDLLKIQCSHWLKLQHSDWRENLAKDFF